MTIRLSVVHTLPSFNDSEEIRTVNSIEVYRNITSFIIDETHLHMQSPDHRFRIKKECIIKIRVRD